MKRCGRAAVLAHQILQDLCLKGARVPHLMWGVSKLRTFWRHYHCTFSNYLEASLGSLKPHSSMLPNRMTVSAGWQRLSFRRLSCARIPQLSRKLMVTAFWVAVKIFKLKPNLQSQCRVHFC